MFPFWLNADLDEVRIYDRALNQDEILALCKTEKKKDTVKIVEAPKEAPLEKRNNEW